MSESKNDIAWNKIFKKHSIVKQVLADGFFSIRSTEINEFREARLMTKFDHRSQLPKLFVENDLSILPTSRGDYIIGTFDTFHNFTEANVEIDRVEFPILLESLNHRDITSETTAINCAFVSKILHKFTEESVLYSTVNGRMSSSSFKFNINSKKKYFEISVENSQIEIDGGYEGDNSLILIEAKNYISDDFLVRQLYYPFRLWRDKISKKVRTVFLTYTNGVFHLREYSFQDLTHYNSLTLLQEKKYIFKEEEEPINIEVIQKILENTKSVKEPTLPFPQADSFDRVINLCELLNQRNYISKEEITQNYDFDARQTDYYINAGKYLGIIDTDRRDNQAVCFLTESGKKLFDTSISRRKIEFMKLILSHTVFRKTLELYLENASFPGKDEIVEIMKNLGLYKVDSDATYFRRASTVSGWLDWILAQLEI